MGAITSRQNAGVEEVDIGVNHAYRYPPKSGNYFSSHFIMGGERFDTAQPEMYLFGENMDVNFLGSRPAPFPYPAPTASEPSKTLKALINIRKESLRFVRAPDDSSVVKEPQAPPPQEPPPASGPNPPAPTPSPSRFNIEFTFDCDVRCAITIMYFCTEEVTTSGMMYTPRDPSKNSETYHYKRGASQQFSQVCHVFDPSQYLEEELLYSFDRDVLPIVIYCVAEEGDVSSAKEVVMECSTSESMSLMRTRNRNGPRNGPRTEPWGTPLLTEPRQSHATFAVVEKHSDGYALKPLKQKLFVDGLSYLLQEIYGIENKNAENCKVSTEEDAEDNGAECVICMCDLRDTLILPCRHLCLCNCCADSLRYQANNCPICRAPFRALLQIKALQKATVNCTNPQANSEGVEGVPAGYEAVSLIEALNGPSASPPSQPTAPPALDLYVQLPQSPAEAPPPPTAPPLDSLHRPLPIHPHPLRGETARCFVESVTVRPGQVEDSTTQTDHHSNTPGHTRPSSPAPQEMRMSVLLAQECDDVCGSKGDDDTGASPPPPQARRRAGRKRSREHHQTRDTVKVVNEIAQPRSLEVVDPSETRSLLDEDPLEGEGGRGAGSDPLDESPPIPPPPPPTAATPPLHHQPHQAEEETIDEEDEDSREEDMKSVIVVTGSTVTESSEGESQRDCQEITNSPVLTPRKNQSGGTRAGGGGEISAPASPGGSVGLNLTHQSEPLSLPGTPLSNTSAVSRSSDASVSSASSTRALLSHPTDVSSSSIV